MAYGYLKTDISQSVSRLDSLSVARYIRAMTIGTKIKQFRQQLGLNQEALAQAAGVPQSQISDLETGKRKTTKFLPEIAQALKRDLGELDDRYSQDNVYRSSSLVDHICDMPVFASSEYGNGMIIVSTAEIGRIPRPHTLEGIEEAYAVLVTGETMIPAYEPGDRAWINPRLPPLQGTDCLLYSSDESGGGRAMIKRLISWTDTEWTVRQHNPPLDFQIKRSEWPTHHRVIGNFRR